MGVLLPARGLASRRICVPCVRRMMLVEYIQNSPARSLFWRVALLGGDGANESSSAGRAGQGTGAGRGGGVVRGCGRAPVPLSLHDQRKSAIILKFLQTSSEGVCRNLGFLACFH